jgi:hypothetical protein
LWDKDIAENNLVLDNKTPFEFGKMEVAKHPCLSKKKGGNPMVQQNLLSEQATNRFSQIFSLLKISQLLRQAGIRKSYGISCFDIFQTLFQLVFEDRNLFRVLASDRADALPRKDVY